MLNLSSFKKTPDHEKQFKRELEQTGVWGRERAERSVRSVAPNKTKKLGCHHKGVWLQMTSLKIYICVWFILRNNRGHHSVETSPSALGKEEEEKLKSGTKIVFTSKGFSRKSSVHFHPRHPLKVTKTKAVHDRVAERRMWHHFWRVALFRSAGTPGTSSAVTAGYRPHFTSLKM